MSWFVVKETPKISWSHKDEHTCPNKDCSEFKVPAAEGYCKKCRQPLKDEVIWCAENISE